MTKNICAVKRGTVIVVLVFISFAQSLAEQLPRQNQYTIKFHLKPPVVDGKSKATAASFTLDYDFSE